MKNATFRQLRVFSEVARHLSFAQAAQSLKLTPPAVTMQVRELEKHVGMPLFDRSGRTVALTTVGEYMLVYARKMLSTLKDAEDAAARLQKLEVGLLTIGTVSTANYFLPHLLAQFRRDHEGIDIKLAVGNREQLVRMLLANEVDIAIMGRPPKDMATRAEPFAAQPHVFVTQVNHSMALRGQLPASALQGQPFIVRERGSGTRAALDRFVGQYRVEPRVVMEMTSNEAIKQAVMAGMGLSFLSLHTIGMELDNRLLAILDIEGAPVVRAWNVVHMLSKVLSPAAEAFRYFVLEHGEDYLAKHFAPHVQLAATATLASPVGPLLNRSDAWSALVQALCALIEVPQVCRAGSRQTDCHQNPPLCKPGTQADHQAQTRQAVEQVFVRREAASGKPVKNP